MIAKVKKARRLAWTRATAEQFWKGMYDTGVCNPRLLRERARHLGFVLAVHAGDSMDVTMLLERDGVLDEVLRFAGFVVRRIDVGPRHDGSEGTIENASPCERSRSLILVPDALAQLDYAEIAPFFATVRASLGPNGRLAITVPNNENLDQRLAIDPASEIMFHVDQQVSSFTPNDIELLLQNHGFQVEVLQELELTDAGFSRESDIASALTANPRIHIGSGNTILAIARLVEDGQSEAPYVNPTRWLAKFKSARRTAARRPEPHALVWTDALINGFWSQIADSPLDELSFNRVNGRAFMLAVWPWLTKSGRILDVGSGDGSLVELLLRNDFCVAAFEPAEKRRRSLDARVCDLPGYLGSIGKWERGTPFDCVTATEVIEHIPDAGLPDFLDLVWSSLAPGGVLLLTTPRGEALERSLVYSPVSGAVFHRWQHMQSWTAERLRGLIEAKGFMVEKLHDVDFTAIASGAAPYAALELASDEAVTIAAGGTWLCIARRPSAGGDHNRLFTAPHIADEDYLAAAGSPTPAGKRVRPPGVNPAATSTKPALASPDRLDVKGSIKSAIGWVAHGPLGQVARRFLPLTVKSRLLPIVNWAEFDYRRSTILRSQTLAECVPILDRVHFDQERVILVNAALAWGGAERQVVTLLRGLEARGYACDLLCMHLGESADHDFYLPQLGSFRGFVRNACSLVDAKKTLSKLSAEQLERIHATVNWMPKDVQTEVLRFLAEFLELRPRAVHAWQDSVSLAAGYAARIAGVPVIVVSSRNLNPTNFAYHRPYMAAAYRQLAACNNIEMVNNSEAGAADYAKWLGIPAERLGLHRNGVDPACFTPAESKKVSALRASIGIPDGAPVVGSIFRLYPEKDPFLWVEAASRVASRRPDVHFVVFGVGPLKSSVESYANKFSFADRLHLPGTIEDPTIAYGLFDVFLLSSRSEGTPNVAIEASLLGVPVVTVPAGGAAETVEDGKTGFVLQERDPIEIAEKVLAVLDDPVWVAGVASRGLHFIQERFGLERMVTEAIGYYQFELRERRG
jgi:glycosyltransferase involved in cell wall biosynthesis/2-polyprenyl-3-methyl-5-hydroxy-6-metoxy-1,4-benzoquinol methylase